MLLRKRRELGQIQPWAAKSCFLRGTFLKMGFSLIKCAALFSFLLLYMWVAVFFLQPYGVTLNFHTMPSTLMFFHGFQVF